MYALHCPHSLSHTHVRYSFSFFILFGLSYVLTPQHTIYVSILEGDKENPLLDSRFPDVSGKGRGYQIQAHAEGLPEWPELRKVSVWQTVGALEQVWRRS
jgi:hypothetical protein